MREHGLQIMGVQEARSAIGINQADDILRISTGSQQGQGGIELWIDLRVPFRWTGRTPWFFDRQHFVVVDRNPRWLLTRYARDDVDYWFLVAHGPHSGRPEGERADWWHQLTAMLRLKPITAPLYVCADCNAKSGGRDHCHVFENDDADSPNTSHLQQFLQDFDLCLPATTSVHVGENATWVSPSGEVHARIDFVMIPRTMLSACTFSTVLMDFDLGNSGWDHRVVGVQLQWDTWTCIRQRAHRKSPSIDRNHLRTMKPGDLQPHITVPSWTCDVEQHEDRLRNQVLCALAGAGDYHSQCPGKKPTVTHEAWQLREQKHQCQRKLKRICQMDRQQVWRAILSGWSDAAKDEKARRHHEQNGALADFVPRLPPLREQMTLSEYPFRISLGAWSLKWAAQCFRSAHQLRKCLRHNKTRLLKDLLTDLAPDTPASQILNQLRPLIGPSNPRKAKQAVYPQVRDIDGVILRHPHDVETAWLNFFGSMEGGVIVPAQELRDRWLADLRRLEPQDSDLGISIKDLPSLAALEAAFRRVPAGKATGPDQLPSEACRLMAKPLAKAYFSALLKLFLAGHEPLIWKGGHLVPVYKGKGARDELSAHRSLLISSNIGKALHRCLRQHQNPFYLRHLHPGQLGGYPRVSVQTGLHMVRAYVRWQRFQGRSSAVLFLDLKEAFYRLMRPLALGSPYTMDDVDTMIQRLGLTPTMQQELHHQLLQPDALDQAEVPSAHRRALQAIHSATWFTMKDGSRHVATTAGSRPGDSFADVLFGYLYASVLKNIEQKLQDFGLLDPVEPAQGFIPATSSTTSARPFMGPTWMDDTAVCFSASTAEGLENKIGPIVNIVLEEIRSRGMTPNLAKGKTELLVSFRGKASQRLKTKYFGPVSSRLFPILGEDQLDHISVTSEYQHLGGLVTADGHSRREIRRRAAQAHLAFTQHRRLLYQNGSLEWAKRKELFLTLVMSKFTYGMSSWYIRDQATKDHLHASIIKLYRRLLKLPADQHATDLEIIGQVQLPSPSDLLRRERLRYLGQLYQGGSTTWWGLLHSDVEWHTLVQTDLDWMWEQLQNASHLGQPREHWPQWEEILQHSPGYWKRLVTRATQHATLQYTNQYHVWLLHDRALRVFQSHGQVQIDRTPSANQPDLDAHHQERHACMACQRRFKSKAGEGAHFFRTHGRVNPLRRLFNTTQCASCMKEYYTYGKLLAHLRHSPDCAQGLYARHRFMDPAPGIGSKEDRALSENHGGLYPPHPAQGPQPPPLRAHQLPDCRDHDTWRTQVLESLLTASLAELEISLRSSATTMCMTWTQMCYTLQDILRQFSNEDAEILEYDLADLRSVFAHLCDPTTWSFLVDDDTPVERYDPEMQFFDMQQQSLFPWKPNRDLPRSFGKHRFVLHAYAGRRRQGDLQHFLDMATDKFVGCYVSVISVDIINNAHYGDLTKPEVQAFWFHSMQRQWVIAVVAGPPCNTWSRAREHELQTDSGDTARGPRVLRSVAEMWGLSSMGVGELRQIVFGNQLLGFALVSMYMMLCYGGLGLLEHPADLAPTSASIWKLPLVAFLQRMPAVELRLVNQGYYGSESLKPTCLLTVRLPGLARHLREWRTCTVAPQLTSTGRQEDGSFRTAKLKEYAPAFCAAMAGAIADALGTFPVASSAESPPCSFLQLCKELTVTQCGSNIGIDTAGQG
eukprot:Skav207582  [mRNA]  locus=scaffold2931:206770:211794:- [translate_table: standard]